MKSKLPTDLSGRNRDVTEATRDQVHSGRKAAVAKAIKMTDAEALAFWPVYDDYANEMTKTDDRTVNLVTNFAENYKNLPMPKPSEWPERISASTGPRHPIRPVKSLGELRIYTLRRK